jgi:hypothetical protein
VWTSPGMRWVFCGVVVGLIVAPNGACGSCGDGNGGLGGNVAAGADRAPGLPPADAVELADRARAPYVGPPPTSGAKPSRPSFIGGRDGPNPSTGSGACFRIRTPRSGGPRPLALGPLTVTRQRSCGSSGGRRRRRTPTPRARSSRPSGESRSTPGAAPLADGLDSADARVQGRCMCRLGPPIPARHRSPGRRSARRGDHRWCAGPLGGAGALRLVPRHRAPCGPRCPRRRTSGRGPLQCGPRRVRRTPQAHGPRPLQASHGRRPGRDFGPHGRPGLARGR